MSDSTNFYQPLYPDEFYHIYNQGNNGVRIFYKEENYHYFLKKFENYLFSFLDIYAYCLLPNHFHFLIKTKQKFHALKDLNTFLKVKLKNSETDLPESFAKLLSESFRRFFMSYSKSINSQQKRSGSLLRKNFKRIIITEESYLRQLVYYIHYNPLHHQLMNDFKEYPYSSYRSIISLENKRIQSDDLLSWFDGLQGFKDFHEDSNEKDIEIPLINIGE